MLTWRRKFWNSKEVKEKDLLQTLSKISLSSSVMDKKIWKLDD